MSPSSVAASAGAGGGGFADFANFDGGMTQPAMPPQSMGPGRVTFTSQTPSSWGLCFQQLPDSSIFTSVACGTTVW